jgi:hypothetical protein
MKHKVFLKVKASSDICESIQEEEELSGVTFAFDDNKPKKAHKEY